MQFTIGNLYMVVDVEEWDQGELNFDDMVFHYCYTSVTEAMRNCKNNEIAIQIRDIFFK